MFQVWARRWVLVSVGVVGCTPVQFDRERHAALVAPHHLGEGDTGKPPVKPEAAMESEALTGEPAAPTAPAEVRAAGAGAGEAATQAAAGAGETATQAGAGEAATQAWVAAKASATSGFLPDPPPQPSRHQWVFDVYYDRGTVRVDFVETRELNQALATPRLVGRFALEFWIGRELLERLRFDFPLLGDETGDPSLRSSVSLAPGVQTSRRVQVARVPRATWAQLVDRATGDTWRLPWPPDALESPPEAEPGP